VTTAPASRPPENLWLNLLFNIIAPSFLLIMGRRLSGALAPHLPISETAWPAIILVIALLFPIAYGTRDLIVRRKWNFLSLVGIASTLLTGGIGLMELSKTWIVVKEAGVPLIFGTAVLASAWTRRPLVRVLLLNESVVNVPKLEAALDEGDRRPQFNKLLVRYTLLISASFLISAVLNAVLAMIIFSGEGGPEQFNDELGRMTMLSFPVIALPMMIITGVVLWKLFVDIKALTGLDIEALFLTPENKKNQS
jgi:intracellular septation protein A